MFDLSETQKVALLLFYIAFLIVAIELYYRRVYIPNLRRMSANGFT